MRIDLERGTLRVGAPEATARRPEGEAGFGSELGRALARIDDVAKTADTAAEGLVTGEVDLHEAMVSMEKADLVLKLGTTVRNKLLEAYQQLVQSSG
jgi:flagellar hook-basal body complex protein FliE